jgi:choline dehydrogenase-like flavoprotein
MPSFDAIIVGSGACGGWAAMQLTQAGMNVLMLEAGSPIDPARDFGHKQPYQLDYRGVGKPGLARKYQGTERNYRIMIDNTENPYTTSEDTVYRWSRSRILGGRTLHWARASDRMAGYEFKAASRDGYGLDWAVSYSDMSPYYDRVEQFIGVSGQREGFPQFPDGEFLPVMPLNCAETIFTAACKSMNWPTTHRRLAQLTQLHNRRPPCHYCGNCINGCDVGAMFSTVSSTLPVALKTGRLTVRTDSVVASVRMNNENRAQGVTYIERFTGKTVDVDAKFVLLAASTLENTRLLLLSAKGGLGNSSGTLGQYMMDQLSAAGVAGYLPKLKGGPSRLDDGKLAGITIPNMVNFNAGTARQDFIRGYVMNATGGQTEYAAFAGSLPGFGSTWKREVKSLYVAQARVWIAGGEMLAQKENHVELDPEVKDHWGIPVLKIHFKHCDNDRKLIAHFQQSADELFRKAGGEKIPGAHEEPQKNLIGGAIHEVGTARMSADPKQGVLNSFCRTHDIPNLYVFGGNAFPSTGDKHPTLTMMALTARGCDHLLDEAKS